MRKIMLLSAAAPLELGFANDGKTAGAAAAAKPATAKSEPAVTIGTIEGFTAPTKPARGGGNASKYPFDSLNAAGEFFGVTGKNARQMGSPVNNANKKYRTEAKDAAGNVQQTIQDRHFYAIDVDAATADRLKGTPHAGATVLVVRDK